MLQNFAKRLQNDSGLAAQILDVFIILNLAFLTVDVFMAHSVNKFAHAAEWIPGYFSICAAVVFAVVVMTQKAFWIKWVRIGIGFCAICLGIAGMLFHLNSRFFSDLTLRNLVYAAPFVAPLAFTGIGLLALLNSMISDTDFAWARWVVLFAWCGWCGNFILSAFDHAQNGFFYLAEWVPVISSAMVVGGLIVLYFKPQQRGLYRYCVIVLGVNIVIGIIGFGLHLTADLQVPAETVTEGFLYGAPLFAPLLFPNLSILALLGLSKL